MKPQINLLHLKYFCDSVKYQSISEAAKANYVTQSAVSQAIAKLEVSLGISIACHSRQKFQTTAQGKILFEQALHIFKAVSEIHVKIDKNNQHISSELQFVSTKSLGMSLLAPHLQKKCDGHFTKNYPNTQISYKLGNLDFIRNTLQNGEAEFGLVALAVYNRDFHQFNRRVLHRGRFQLYQHTETSPELLKKGVLVDFTSCEFVEKLCEHYTQTLGNPLKIQMELQGWEVVSYFTNFNIGVGFFPDYLLFNNRYPELKRHPLEIPHFEYEICAIYNKGKELSSPAIAFLDDFNFGGKE